MTILHFIGQFFLHWLVLFTPAQGPATSSQTFFFTQHDAIEQMAAMPFWKKPGPANWSLLSEAEEANPGNEKDGDDTAPVSTPHELLWHFSTPSAAKPIAKGLAFGNIPLYLRLCNLKVDMH